MRFSKQPNGKWCGYSTISDSFYCAHLDEKHLVGEVIRDIVKIDSACGNIPSPREDKALIQYLISVAIRAEGRIASLLEDGGYDFDNIIESFTYDEDDRQTRAYWVRKFKLMGAGKEQMDKVNKRIDYLQVNGELSSGGRFMMSKEFDDEKLDELYSFMLVYLHSKRKEIKTGGYKELVNVLAEITARMTKRFVEEECGKRFTSEEAVKFISNLTRVLWETCDDKINDMEGC